MGKKALRLLCILTAGYAGLAVADDFHFVQYDLDNRCKIWLGGDQSSSFTGTLYKDLIRGGIPTGPGDHFVCFEEIRGEHIQGAFCKPQYFRLQITPVLEHESGTATCLVDDIHPREGAVSLRFKGEAAKELFFYLIGAGRPVSGTGIRTVAAAGYFCQEYQGLSLTYACKLKVPLD